MPRLVPLLTVAVVLLAGCTGTPGTNPGGTETTAATTTSPATTTASIPDGSLAPGVTDDGVENVSALLDAHASALRERGFELAVEWTTGSGYAVRQRHRVAPNVSRLRTNATFTVAGNRTVQQGWLNETMTRMLTRVQSDGETRYRVPPVGPVGEAGRERRHRQLAQTNQVERLLRGGEFEVTDVRTDDGTRRYTLVGENFSTGERYGEREIRLRVSADGVIDQLTADGETVDGGQFAFNYTVSETGVRTVERPGWVADAPAVVDTRPTVGFQNCTAPYLVVENPGPDALPAGSVVSVTLNGTEHRATLATALPADGRRALYLDAAGDIRTASPEDVPADRRAMPKDVRFTVATGEGMLLTNGAGGFSCASAGAGESGSEEG